MLFADPSVPLRRYAESRAHAKVRFACADCGSGHDVEAARVVWLLKALDLGDEDSPVSAAAEIDNHPCVRCGGRHWECWPHAR